MSFTHAILRVPGPNFASGLTTVSAPAPQCRCRRKQKTGQPAGYPVMDWRA